MMYFNNTRLQPLDTTAVKTLRCLVVLAVALFSCSRISLAMAEQLTVVKIPDFTTPAGVPPPVPTYEDWFSVNQLSYTISNLSNASLGPSNANQRLGNRMLFDAILSYSSALISTAMVTRTVWPSVEVRVLEDHPISGEPKTVITYLLREVVVSSVTQNNSRAFAFTLEFKCVGMQTSKFDEFTEVYQTSGVFEWDFVTNEAECLAP